MKTLLLRASALAVSLLLVSCAGTGDPYDDSLFFSPKLADQRHNQMRKDLGKIEQDTADARADADARGNTLSGINQANQVRRNEIARVKARIKRLEEEKDSLDRDIADARQEGRNDAVLLKERSDTEAEIDGLNRKLQKLIQIQ